MRSVLIYYQQYGNETKVIRETLNRLYYFFLEL